MNQKEGAYNFCGFFVEERLARIQNGIASIKESLTSETKSSAGDKHETGRAMLQLEREKLGTHLADAEATKQVLSKVNIDAKLGAFRSKPDFQHNRCDFLSQETFSHIFLLRPAFALESCRIFIVFHGIFIDRR